MSGDETEEIRQVLAEVTRRYRRTEKAHEESRKMAIDAVLRALRAGERPADVERNSPFTGSYIRRIARENGIEPDARYIRQPPTA